MKGKNDSTQEVKLKWFDIRLERNIMARREEKNTLQREDAVHLEKLDE